MLLNKRATSIQSKQFIAVSQSSNQLLAARLRAEPVDGKYMSKDMRLKTKLTLQTAHFKIGGADQSKL